MNNDLRRFAPLGLWLALVALVVTAILYFVQREWNIYVQVGLALVVIGLAAFAYFDPDRLRKMLTGRQARYGSNTLVLTLAFVGILGVINYLAYSNPKTWDLTEDQMNTLAPETLETLQKLPAPVQALAFYSDSTNPGSTENVRKVLERYQQNGNDKFEFEFIDPDADPLAASSLGVQLDPGGTLVLKMDDRVEKVTYPTEREITAAMVRLMSEKQNVYFLTGHGEYNPEETGEESYSAAKATLESKSYVIATLNLVAERQIPADADLIIVAGARVPVTEAEVNLIDQFLATGGGLIVLSEPLPLTDFGNQPDPLGDYLAQNWNIDLGEDVVVDLSDQQSPFAAYVAEYNLEQPITSALNDQGLGAAFPTARSVTALNSVADVSASVLMYTAQQSWAETNLEIIETQGVEPNEGEDLIGRVPLGVAATNSGTGSRVVVIGDSDFAMDAYFSALGNGDLLVNSIDWVTEQESIISLTPKEPTQRVLIPSTTVNSNLILLGSIILPLGLVVVTGITVAMKRRRQG